MADTAIPSAPAADKEPLLRVKDLRKYFPIRQGFFGRSVTQVRAVDGVTFDVFPGETMAVVGESGCGKTTAGRCLVRAFEPTGGSILYRNRDGDEVALDTLDNKSLKPVRRELRMIFQDPFSSLNPRMTVLDIIGDPLRVHGIASGSELENRVADMLLRVGLRPEYMRRYPHAFSGGQRQRIGIAKALILSPQLVVADEAVSALDVSVQAQILNLLQELQAEFNLTYVFIAHDLSVVEYIADRVSVMYVGKMVEKAATDELYHNPKHPYTEALLSAVPRPDPRERSQRIVLEGDVPDPAHPPSGCYFHPRCRYAQDVCATETPELRPIGEGHEVACHLAEDLDLRGITDLVPRD